MNSKAIKRQLLAAIAMVLVAAIALGSSTYAWFVASGSVTATGMNVNVQSTGGLLIKYAGVGDAWGQTASAKMTEEKLLLPASTKDMTKWSTATATLGSNYAMNPDSIKPVTLSDTAENITDNNYVVKQTFYVRSTGNTDGGTKGLYINDVKVTANQELNMAMRIGIIAKYGQTQKASFIMAPIKVGDATVTDGYTVYEASLVSGTTDKYEPKTLGTVNLTQKGTNAAILPSTEVVPGNSDSDYVTVHVFIWYEGQDEHLYSDNVKANEGLSITLEFACNSSSATSSSSSGTTTGADLKSASLSGTTVTVNSVTYTEISDVTLNSKKLYVQGTDAISSSSQIFTITGDIVTNVTSSCTLPEASGG